MFYVMCFRTNPSARVFVDEPEISLSLSEQIKIVDRIQAVFQYTKGQAILITHSPFIAAGHEDLLAEVKFNG
jgi:predicted ATPase